MIRSIAVACAALLLAAACSKKQDDAPAGSKPVTDSPAPATPAAEADRPAASTGGACDFAPPAKVSAALGLPGFELKDGRSEGPVTICSYHRNDKPRTLMIRVERGSGKAAFENNRTYAKDQQLEEVAGLGDSAFTYVEGGGDYAALCLAVLQGTTSLAISMVGGDPAKLKELAGQILPAL
jgi:hypothetical protein